MIFRDPVWFVATVIPVAVLWVAWRRRPAGTRFPTIARLRERIGQGGWGTYRLPLLLRVAALLLLVIALARPQHGLEHTRVRTEGIDIVLVVDVSTSMLAEDFTLNGRRYNRLEIVRTVAKDFIEGRPNDRIGLVVFAGRPYTPCPLTLDHAWLLEQFDRAHIGMVEDGTAIGSAVATGLNRLRHSQAASRVLILLTDGVNNAGTLAPTAAAELAQALSIKVYTIGAGSTGMAPYPATDFFGRKVYRSVPVEIDEASLRQMAQLTGGRYFRATDTESLEQVYQQIDQMEKTAMEQPVYQVYQEQFPRWLIPALVLLCAELVLGQTWLRILP